MSLITVSEARELVRKTHGDISEATIRSWIRSNILSATKENEKQYLVDKREFLLKFPTILTIFIEKGGTGKTITAANLADYFSSIGLSVLIVGFDPQMNIEKKYFKYGELTQNKSLYDYFENGTPLKKIVLQYDDKIDLLPASKTLGKKRNQYDTAELDDFKKDFTDLYKKYDIVIQDTGPVVDSLPILAMILCHYVIIPLPPEDDSLDGAIDALEHINRYTKYTNSFIDYKILLNNYEFVGNRGIAIHNHYAKEIKDTFKDKVVEGYIPHYIKMKERRATKKNSFNNEEDKVFQKQLRYTFENLDKSFFEDRYIG